MGYESSADLADLFPIESAARAAERMAERGGEFLRATARERTPVRSGAMRKAWIREPTEEGAGLLGERRFTSTVRNTDWLAWLIEHGTEAHDIAPKLRHALEVLGEARASAHVHGIVGRHMMASALTLLEVSTREVLAGEVEWWARETSIAADAAARS